MFITALPPELRMHIFSYLDWIDLLSIEATCLKFRKTVTPYCKAWKHCCHRRWHGPFNTRLCTASSSPPDRLQTNWRQIFLSGNRWFDCRLSVQYLTAHDDSSVSAMTSIQRADHEAVVGCANGNGFTITLFDTSVPATDTSTVSWHGQNPRGASAPGSNTLWTSLALLSDQLGIIIAGGINGNIMMYQTTRSAFGLDAKPARALRAWSGCSSPVVHMSHLPVGEKILALHDGLSTRSRDGVMRLLDVEGGREVFRTRELFDGYQLAACVAVDEHGSEVLGASVKLSEGQQAGGECMRCAKGVPPSLCFHKSHTSTAVLCMFDTRTTAGMVQRYATCHRSLFPHLELVRQHFLLTSHAGCPLAVWDRRNLNGPVYEEHPLPEKHCCYSLTDVFLSNDEPHHRSAHLSSSSDWLVGYSDSGKIWMWDLSEKLGWADGSHCGNWLKSCASLQEQCDGSSWHDDENDYERKPSLLGAMLCPDSVQVPGQYEQHWTPVPKVTLGHDYIAGLGCLPPLQNMHACDENAHHSWGPNTAFFLQLS